MLEKMKEMEAMSLEELIELKQALLAIDLGLDSETITIGDIENVQTTVEGFFEDESIGNFIDERIIDIFHEVEENNK